MNELVGQLWSDEIIRCRLCQCYTQSRQLALSVVLITPNTWLTNSSLNINTLITTFILIHFSTMFKSTHCASKNCPLLKRTVQVPIFVVFFFKLWYTTIQPNTGKYIETGFNSLLFFGNRKKGNLWRGKDTTKVKTANSKTTLGRGKF